MIILLKRMIFIILFLSVLGVPMLCVLGQIKNSNKLEVIGLVIAHEIVPTNLLKSEEIPNTDVLIVKLNKVIKGQNTAGYIKVIYKHGIKNPALPKNIYDGNSQWKFKLKRDYRCDGSLGDSKYIKGKSEDGKEVLIPRFNFLNETEKLSEDIILFCYVLQFNDIKLVS